MLTLDPIHWFDLKVKRLDSQIPAEVTVNKYVPTNGNVSNGKPVTLGQMEEKDGQRVRDGQTERERERTVLLNCIFSYS